MPKPKHHEKLVKKMVSVAERQWNAAEAKVDAGEERSVSEFIRTAIDRALGLDIATLDPRANEQERVA
jgi:hypothetical protein